MRFKPGGRWMSFTATQEYDTRTVAFSWKARFRVAPMIWITVIDEYRGGVGALEAQLWGFIRVMRASGPDLSKGEVSRYLGELFWTPFSIAANEELRWEVDPAGATMVTTDVDGEEVSVRFSFDADSVEVSMPARPRQVGKESIDTPWHGRAWEFVSIGGLSLPRRAAVSWDLPDGRFEYFEGRITQVAWS